MTIQINPPTATSTHVDSDGTISFQPVVMFAKAVPESEQNDHINPWSLPPDPSEIDDIQLISGVWAWVAPSLPLPNATLCTLIVWGLPSSTMQFEREHCDFTAGGSGYAEKCARSMAPCGMPPDSPDDVLLTDVMPRTYKMSVVVRSVPLAGACSDFLLEGMLTSSYVYLTYDPRLSTPTEAVWLGTNLADPSSHWALRVMRKGGTWCAIVVLRQLSRRRVEAPLVWSCAGWDVFASNQLSCLGDASAASAPATLIVEPA
jgi:hypothetical protein